MAGLDPAIRAVLGAATQRARALSAVALAKADLRRE